MSRFITFAGVTRFTPGAISRVNTDSLNQIPTNENGIIAIAGEAEGGAPGTLVTLRDPSKAREIFRSGALADSIPTAFQASSDPGVPGGATAVICYKTNNSTQAIESMPSPNASTILDSTATDGTDTTLEDTAITGVGANVDDYYTDMWIVIRPYTATAEIRRITDYDAGTKTFTFAAISLAVSASDTYLVLEDEVILTDTLTASSATTLTPTAVMIADEFVGRWVYIQASASTVYLRKVVSNTTTVITFTPAIPTALPAGAFFEILANSYDLTTLDYGSHTNGVKVDSITDGVVVSDSKVTTLSFEGNTETSPEVGGAMFMSVLYKGGITAITDAAEGPDSTSSVIELLTGGLTPDQFNGYQVAVTHGGYTEYTQIVTNAASVLNVSPSLSFTPSNGDVVEIKGVVGAYSNVHVEGSSGVATSLQAFVAAVGFPTLDITFTAGMTLRDLVTTINSSNSNFEATVAAGINPDLSLCEDFDFGPSTQASVVVSSKIAESGLRQDNVANVNYFNSRSELVSAVRSSAHAYDGAQTSYDVTDVFLSGGTRGTSDNSAFQSAMDAFLTVRANSVVPLIDEDLVNEGFGSTATVASVAAQLGAHVALARGAGESERGGFIGFQGTKDEIIDQANALNDGDVALVCQNVTTLNIAGSLQTFGPRMFAVMAASMRAGVSEVGDPLTHKYIRCSGISNDSSWDPADKTDSADMVLGGVLFAEKIEGKGVRWVRDLTTYVKDDNLAWSEGSVRDIVRYYAYGLRNYLVDRFVGKKASPVTISAVKDAVVDYSQLLKDRGLIVDSTDPATGKVINAYHNIKVTSSGDVVTVNVGFFPAPGINFILNDLFVQLAQQAA